jgi:hypothetical protein
MDYDWQMSEFLRLYYGVTRAREAVAAYGPPRAESAAGR